MALFHEKQEISKTLSACIQSDEFKPTVLILIGGLAIAVLSMFISSPNWRIGLCMVGCIVSMVGADRLCKIIVYVQNPRLKNQKKTVQRETLKNGEDKPGMPD